MDFCKYLLLKKRDFMKCINSFHLILRYVFFYYYYVDNSIFNSFLFHNMIKTYILKSAMYFNVFNAERFLNNFKHSLIQIWIHKATFWDTFFYAYKYSILNKNTVFAYVYHIQRLDDLSTIFPKQNLTQQVVKCDANFLSRINFRYLISI